MPATKRGVMSRSLLLKPVTDRKFKRYFAIASSGMHHLGCVYHREPPHLAVSAPAARRLAVQPAGSRLPLLVVPTGLTASW